MNKTGSITLLGANEDIWHVLVFAEQRDVQQDLEWLGISSQHNELGDTTVQSLGGYVGTNHGKAR